MILQVKIWKDRLFICDVFPFNVYEAVCVESSDDIQRADIIDCYLIQNNYELKQIKDYQNGYLLSVERQIMVDSSLDELLKHIRY
jgi:hypothetical protein